MDTAAVVVITFPFPHCLQLQLRFWDDYHRNVVNLVSDPNVIKSKREVACIQEHIAIG